MVNRAHFGYSSLKFFNTFNTIIFIYQGVASVRDLKRWLQSANKKLEATNRLRQYAAESMAKQRNLEMELVSAKSHTTELGNSNKVFQASI